MPAEPTPTDFAALDACSSALRMTFLYLGSISIPAQCFRASAP